MNIIILGSTGMLGSAMCRVFDNDSRYNVIAMSRSPVPKVLSESCPNTHFASGFNAESIDTLMALLAGKSIDVIINCVGLIKQHKESEDVLASCPINSLLPHRLAQLCQLMGARLVHFSTDCVFSGKQGNYTELDFPDCNDVYGRTKLLGEVGGLKNAITIRTSIIGHELSGNSSLLEWFLSQPGPVNGYTKALFSGLPTNELAKVVANYVVPNKSLAGLYNVSAQAISKYDLLKLVGDTYGTKTQLVKCNSVDIDRTLDSTKFKSETSYNPPSWEKLIAEMYQHKWDV